MDDTSAHAHRLYVIEFSDNVVKVGRTKNLMQRLRHHASDARDRGARTTRRWATCEHAYDRVLADERRLIGFCAERWPLAWGAEYFAGADFEAVLDFMDDLDWQALNDERSIRTVAA